MKVVKFVIYFWFVSWQDISFGVSLHLGKAPHLEIHIPFGFIKIGWVERHLQKAGNHNEVKWRQHSLYPWGSEE